VELILIKKNNDTAYPHRKALAWMQILCRWGSNSDTNKQNNYCAWEDFIEEPKKLKWIKKFYKEFINMAEDSICGAYINCPDSDLKNWSTEYYGNNLEKLIEIKKKWDPHKRFNFPQGLAQLY